MREAVLKHTRFDTDQDGRKKLSAFLAVPPERIKANPFYRCPAGPGRRDVPSEGRWYIMTEYLRRRVACGDLVCVAPPKTDKPKAAKAAKQGADR